MLIMILAAILAIVVVVTIHELGHYWVARAVGIRVLKFSIGFGKALWRIKTRSGTEFALSMIPLGGFVKMLGDGIEPVSVADRPFAYNHKPVWARLAVVVAGPLANFILAIVLFFSVFIVGVPVTKPIVGQVLQPSLAYTAGFKKGDELVSVNGQPMEGWAPFAMALIEFAHSRPITVGVKTANNQSATYTLNLLDWQPDPNDATLFKSIGIKEYTPPITPILSEIEPNTPAQLAGFRSGDQIVAVEDQPVSDWQAIIEQIREHPNDTMHFKILRAGKTQALMATLASKVIDQQTVGFLGAMVKAGPTPAQLLTTQHFSFFGALGQAFEKTASLIGLNMVVLWKLITGKLSVKLLGGPITVFQGAGQASQYGWIAYVSFVAFVNIALGFVNLLPIPTLDGGHVVFLLAEAIRRKPLSQRVQFLGLCMGLCMLITLMLLSTYNDIMRLLLHSH